MCTSLQNIVNVHSEDLTAQNLNQLFHHKQYPQFQLKELYLHPLYSQNDHFRFFMDVLEEWNRKIQKNQIHNNSETLFSKNIFILNSLRNAIRQYKINSEHILNQIFNWFNLTRNTKVKIVQKKQNQEQCDEDWKIRNTFKSNLPAEIDLYKRRIFWHCKDSLSSNKYSMQIKKKVLMEGEEIVNKNDIEKKRIIKIEHELVRSERQERELSMAKKRWKIKKQRENQANTKYFYKETFSNNKIFFPLKNIENKMMKSQSKNINSRVHTTMGFRTKKSSDMDFIRRSQTQINTLDRLVKKSSNMSTGDEVEGKAADGFAEFAICNVDGLNLLGNPYEKKLKLKKRRERTDIT